MSGGRGKLYEYHQYLESYETYRFYLYYFYKQFVKFDNNPDSLWDKSDVLIQSNALIIWNNFSFLINLCVKA